MRAVSAASCLAAPAASNPSASRPSSSNLLSLAWRTTRSIASTVLGMVLPIVMPATTTKATGCRSITSGTSTRASATAVLLPIDANPTHHRPGTEGARRRTASAATTIMPATHATDHSHDSDDRKITARTRPTAISCTAARSAAHTSDFSTPMPRQRDSTMATATSDRAAAASPRPTGSLTACCALPPVLRRRLPAARTTSAM